MSTLDVISEVLREAAPRALSARQITDLAGCRLPTVSRTPQTVVRRDLSVEVKRNGASSKFLRAAPGEFLLKEALPTAFYSDIDGYAAQWTRNLIAAGELAPGVVDERSIRDLKPADVAGYRQFHAFSGVGIWSRALRDAGVPDSFNVWSGSVPCQPWSSAGRRKGHADDRDLWPEWFRLITACRPAVLIGEQVSSKDGLVWLDVVFDDLENANYACQAFDLPACSVGAPHRRQRLYFVAYARERGREILGSSWLHDRGQRGDDAARCSAIDGGDAGTVFDAHGERRERCASDDDPQGNGWIGHGGVVDAAGTSDAAGVPEDARADRGDAIARAEADDEWGTTGDLELESGGDDDDTGGVSDAASRRRHEGSTIGAGCERDDRAVQDGDRSSAGGVDDAACAVPDAERVVWDEGWESLPYGREAIEPDRYGEADGAGCGCVRLGDTGIARGGRYAGEVFGEESAGEGERIEARDLAHESRASGAIDDWALGEFVRNGTVRGSWSNANWMWCRPAPGQKNGCWRPVEPVLIKILDGYPAPVGALRPEEVVDVETAEADAAQVLHCLWPQVGAQALQWGFGRFVAIQAAEVLRPALHGCWDGGKYQSSQCTQLAEAEREAGGEVLFPLRAFRQTSLRTSSGRESVEQRPVELDDFVRLLSSSIAFAEFRSDHRTAEALHAVLETCGAEGFVSCPSGQAAKIWRSIADTNKGRLLVCLGQFRRASIAPLLRKEVSRKRGARLRGYGNAIVLPLATTFVGAVIDALVETSLSIAGVDTTKEIA